MLGSGAGLCDRKAEVGDNGPPVGWQPRTFIDMRTFNVEMESAASLPQVADFYRDVFRTNGFTILNETVSANRVFLEGRSPDRMHKFSINALKRSRDTFIRLTDHFTLPRD